MRIVDKDALVQIKIPFPLPLSWGRTVKPYEPASCVEERDGKPDAGGAEPCSRGIEQDSILAMDWSALRKDFQVSRATLSAHTSLGCKLTVVNVQCSVNFAFRHSLEERTQRV